MSGSTSYNTLPYALFIIHKYSQSIGPAGKFYSSSGKDVVPGAIIYNDMNALLEMSSVHSPGTLGNKTQPQNFWSKKKFYRNEKKVLISIFS